MIRNINKKLNLIELFIIPLLPIGLFLLLCVAEGVYPFGSRSVLTFLLAGRITKIIGFSMMPLMAFAILVIQIGAGSVFALLYAGTLGIGRIKLFRCGVAVIYPLLGLGIQGFIGVGGFNGFVLMPILLLLIDSFIDVSKEKGLLLIMTLLFFLAGVSGYVYFGIGALYLLIKIMTDEKKKGVLPKLGVYLIFGGISFMLTASINLQTNYTLGGVKEKQDRINKSDKEVYNNTVNWLINMSKETKDDFKRLLPENPLYENDNFFFRSSEDVIILPDYTDKISSLFNKMGSQVNEAQKLPFLSNLALCEPIALSVPRNPEVELTMESENPFENLNALFHNILGTETERRQNIYIPLEYEQEEIADTITISFTQEKGMPIYLYLDGEEGKKVALTYRESSAEAEKLMEINCNQITQLDLNNSGGKITLSYEKSAAIKSYIASFDDVVYESMTSRLAGHIIHNVSGKNNYLEGTITVEEGEKIFLALPFNKQLRVLLNGEKAIIEPYAGTYVMIPVENAGDIKIEISYLGIHNVTAILLLLLGLVAAVIYFSQWMKTINEYLYGEKSIDDDLKNMLLHGRVGKRGIKIIDIIAVLGISFLGLVARLLLYSYESRDYLDFLLPWSQTFKNYGFMAVYDGFCDYTPPYLYYLYLAARLEINPLIAIKTLSVVFDYILAMGTGAIVYQITGRDRKNGIMSYAFVVMTPTVIANSAMWAQCDSIYTSLIILMILLFLKGYMKTGMLCYAAAFCLKLQSIFFLPAIVVLWIYKKRLKLYMFLLIPMLYVICIIPVWIGGRSFMDLLLTYVRQSKAFPWLSLKNPNVYYLLGVDNQVELYSTPAIIFTASLLALLIYFIVRKIKEQKFSDDIFIHVSFLIQLIVTFFLPFMHERYGYLATILAIIYGICNKKKLYIPVLHILITYIAYAMYFNETIEIPVYLLSAGMLFILIDTANALYRKVHVIENHTKSEA